MVKAVWLAFAGMLAANSAAFAALPDGVTISADKRVVTAVRTVAPNAPVYSAPPVQKTKRAVIFDNLATLDPLGVYMAGTGFTVGGPNSVVGQAYQAAAFVPAASGTVTEVQAALGYILGAKEGVLVSIYSDASGLPGTSLWSAKVKMPVFGDCCTVVTARNSAGLPIVAGTQYWMVVTTLAGGTDTFGAWAFNVADQVHSGLTATNLGSGWIANQQVPDLAFAVFGN